MLGKIGNKLERIEEEIFEGEGDDVVRDISNAKQEIINFRKIVRPQRLAFRDLERNKARYIAEDLDIYFDDLIDGSERAWDMLENYKEVVEGLEATNESAIAHRTNETFRVLTAISLIFLPLTLIASLFGMNVHLPWEDSPHAFWIIIGCDARDRDRRRPRSSDAAAGCDHRGVEALSGDERPKRMLVIINPVATKMSDRVESWSSTRSRAATTSRRGRPTPRAMRSRSAARRPTHGYDVVVAFGGDGTVNEAANGLAGTATALDLPARRLQQRRGQAARHPDRPRRRHRAPAAHGRPLGAAHASTSGIVNGRYFTFAAGMGLDASRGRARRPQPAR